MPSIKKIVCVCVCMKENACTSFGDNGGRWFDRLLCGSSSIWMLTASDSVLDWAPCIEFLAGHQPGILNHFAWFPRTVVHQNWTVVRSMELFGWSCWCCMRVETEPSRLLLTSHRSSQLPWRSLSGVLGGVSKWISEKMGPTLFYVHHSWFHPPDLCSW